jgi:hypothetical protein
MAEMKKNPKTDGHVRVHLGEPLGAPGGQWVDTF